MQHEKFILKPGDLPPQYPVCEHVIMGRSKAALELRQMIDLAAMANYPVLINGPIGSGKESVARALHATSLLRDDPFIALNCAHMTDKELGTALSDSTIWGMRYIDGIENLTPELQLRLIRRIDQDTISGHQRSRVVAATPVCLTGMITDGLFDKNLYYRLSLLTIPVPPLCQRRDDIPAFINHFLMQMDRDVRFKPDKAALDFLIKHDWPGNIRELHNVMTRGALFHPGQCVGIDRMRALTRMGQPHRRSTRRSDPAPLEHSAAPNGFDLKAHLDNEEARFLRHALDQCNGVIKQAAEMSGIRRNIFVKKMHQHGIQRLGEN